MNTTKNEPLSAERNAENIHKQVTGIKQHDHGSSSSHKDSHKHKRKHRKQKLLRPNSPAAYPVTLPIRNEYRQIKEVRTEQTTGLSSKEDEDKEQHSKQQSAINPVVKKDNSESAFQSFRVHYLIIHIAIMLADGLQGTHLYVLYEGYGYTVASLYSLGFLSGALTSPFIGPLVDKIGRRNSAVAYCALEIAINLLEQYDNLMGLIFSRVVGGITTNLLFTVFESWLVTEHRKRGFAEEKLETILRDSVVASNLSAIASGCIAHYCALLYGPTGPFSGAVSCTFIALILVATRWEENYGSDVPEMKSIRSYMSEAFNTIISDSKIARIGLIQGLTEGALQTFVFLWSPALRHFAKRIPIDNLANGIWGIDVKGEPAYGLIFGAFMACGALGGLVEPPFRRVFSCIVYNSPKLEKKSISEPNLNNVVTSEHSFVSETSQITTPENESMHTSTQNTHIIQDDLSVVKESSSDNETEDDSDSENESSDEKPMAVELLASFCFIISAGLLATPVIVDEDNPYAFTLSLLSFLMYEFVVGLYMPCEGVLRSIYMPNDSICSLMTMLRVIVNVAVALGVISSNYIPFVTAFGWCSCALIVAAILQLTLVSKSEWLSLSQRASQLLPFQQFTKSTQMPSLKLLSQGSSISSTTLNETLMSPATVTIERKNQ